MEENTKACPCCGRHCDLSNPGCERGAEYARTGVIPERGRGHEYPHSHPHEHEHEHEHEGGCGHGPHGFHGRPFGGRSVTEAEFYAGLDTDGKIMALLRELGHAGRCGPDGRGGQGRVLHILSNAGTMSQRELTEKLGIQPGSASELLTKLETAGLITRTPSEEDRRSVTLRLTSEGEARAAEAHEHRHEGKLLAALDAAERETLLGLLEKLSVGLATLSK